MHGGRSLWQRAPAVVVSAAALTVALGVYPRRAGADIASDAAQVAQLKAQIWTQSARVQTLVRRANDMQKQMRSLDARIAREHALLGDDERAEAAATADARHVVMTAYMNGGGTMTSSLALLTTTAERTDLWEHSHYLGAINARLTDALSALRRERDRVNTEQRALQHERAHATALARQLTRARHAVEAAIMSEHTTLTRVSAHLQALVVAAAAEQRDRQQLATEHALAALPWLPHPNTPLPIPAPSPGQYANPLRAITALTPERIDQGVDYSGIGPIYALGDGVVIATTIPGWPGGTFIAYELINGPANGLVVYAAEDIIPIVQIGDTVNANTALGITYAGPDGIETGWADGANIGNTMARTYGEFNGSNTTAFGANFSQLLQQLGAPGGIAQNNPPTGSLPPDWPHW